MPYSTIAWAALERIIYVGLGGNVVQALSHKFQVAPLHLAIVNSH